MKKIPHLILLILIVAILSVSCTQTEEIKCYDEPESNNDQQDGNKNPDTSESFSLTGVVLNVTNRIEIEVTNSDYAYGVYWVLVSNDTTFFAANGSEIALSDIKAGDNVEIIYGGQVMMSYPPQIVAHRVTIK